MPSIKITDRLSNGETLLLDGGTGSELQRRGANVLKGATGDTSKQKTWAWSANLFHLAIALFHVQPISPVSIILTFVIPTKYCPGALPSS